MVRSAVHVYLRTRPTSAGSSSLSVQQDGKTIKMLLPKNAEAGLINNQLEHLLFKYDGILPKASQETVYSTCAQDVVDHVLRGYNGTIFAYGQTGAGKTYTMSGDTQSYQQRGIVPRAIHQIFKEIDMRVDQEVVVRASYLEIYNEVMYDLLADHFDTLVPSTGASSMDGYGQSSEQYGINHRDAMGGSKKGHHKGTAVGDPYSGHFLGSSYKKDTLHVVDAEVKGLVKRVANTEEEALALFFAGESIRSTSKHALNSNSSRSHCIFTLYLETKQGSDSLGMKGLQSKLTCVDLAGSERTKKTHASGQTLKEAMFINKSLSFLEQTVNALSKASHSRGASSGGRRVLGEDGTSASSDQGNAFVPFRQSKLTSVLKDALGGNCKTVMIGNIWPEDRHLEETISTLRFASRVRQLTTNAVVNERRDPEFLVKKYERQVANLKQELAMRDALSGTSNRLSSRYGSFSEAEKQEIKRIARKMLNGETPIEDVTLHSLNYIRELFMQVKQCADEQKSELGNKHASAMLELETKLKQFGSDATKVEAASKADEGKAASDEAASAAVGESDKPSGFHVGNAPSDARPDRGAGTPVASMQNQEDLADTYQDVSAPMPLDLSPALGTSMSGSIDKSTAFDLFKYEVEEGRNLSMILKERKKRLTDLRHNLRDQTMELNSGKEEIDSLTHALKNREGTKSEGDQDVVDEEQYKYMQSLKTAKRNYREVYQKVRDSQLQVQTCSRDVVAAKVDLYKRFNDWYPRTMANVVSRDELLAKMNSLSVQADEENELLDASEHFDKVEMQRIILEDPDSLAFHTAKKSLKKMTPLAKGKTLRGEKAKATMTRRMERDLALNFGLKQ
ncbi:kinesin [Chloropicon primus]|nr:kinesin [Chloropicon primus]